MLARGTIYKLRLDYCINILISYQFFNIFLRNTHYNTQRRLQLKMNAEMRTAKPSQQWEMVNLWAQDKSLLWKRGREHGGWTLLPLEAVIIINWSATLSWSGIWHLLASFVANWFGLKPKLIPALTVRSSLRFRFAWTVSSPSSSLPLLCIFGKRLMCRLWVMHLLALRGAALMSFNFNFSFNQKCISL